MMETGLTTDHHAENVEKLQRMAEQIADFFKSYPDAEASAAVADHINQFWTGRMRGDFLAAFSDRPEDLPPLLRHALPQIRPGRGG